MMHLANDWAGSGVNLLWRASWQGGIFVAIIWAACRLIPSMPAQAKRWLWWLACLQMGLRITPVGFLTLPIMPAQTTRSVAAATANKKLESAIEFSIPSAGTAEPTSPTQPEVPEKPSGMLLLGTCWLLGCLALSAIALRRWGAVKGLIRGSEDTVQEEVLATVRDLSSEMNIPKPSVVESALAPCPMVAGWLHPVLILPSWAVQSLDEAEIKLAIYHELLHIKRRDLWLGLAPTLVKGLFFFNPLAWLASHEASLACEEACDAETLRLSQGSPTVYARLLLTSAQAGTSVAALGTALGYKSLQRRITMLKRSTPTTSARSVRASALLVALAAICALPWSVTAQAAAHVSAIAVTTPVGHTLAQSEQPPTQSGPRGMIIAGPMISELKTVQKELKLTDDQIARIKAITPPDEGLNAPPQKMTRGETDAKMKEILNDRQYTRYQQLVIQGEGPMAFYRPEVQKKLELSDDENSQIKSIIDADNQAVHPIPADGDIRAAIGAHEKELMGKLMGVLTDAQKATWKTMVGAKFDFPELPAANPGAPAPAPPASNAPGGGVTVVRLATGATMSHTARPAPTQKARGAKKPKKQAIASVHAAPASAKPAVHATPKPADDRMTMNFEGASLRIALAKVFEHAGVEYSIAPNVPDAPISCGATKATLRETLDAIIAAAPKGVNYRIEGKLYKIVNSAN